MPLRRTVLLRLCLPALAGLLVSGCGGDGGDQPAPKAETFQRTSRLWPNVPPPPEPSANASGSLQPGTDVGGAAPAAPPATEAPADETPAGEAPAGETDPAGAMGEGANAGSDAGGMDDAPPDSPNSP